MGPEIYQAVRELVYRKAGINLGEGRQALVYARLGKRLRALEIETYPAYLEYLQNDATGEEIVHLLDVISTNHTFFFREPDHFEALTDHVKAMLHKGMRRLRIWCAAASTGEEPYTLSMVIQEACGSTPVDLRILATDISTQVLRQCKRGTYPAAKIEGIPPELLQRWWDHSPDDPNHWSASAALRAPLNFARLNLMEDPYPMKGPFDIIFCRNVMIYFDGDGRRKLVREALRLLRPGGLFVVGHAESLSGMSTGFKSLRPSVYLKQEHA